MKSKRNPIKPIVFLSASSSKMGLPIALFFKKKGYDLILHYYQSSQKASLVAQKVGALEVVQGDLSQESICQKIALLLEKKHQKLDVLVNISGVYHEKKIHKLSEKEWNEGLQSTASATFFLTRALLPFLRRSKHGRIINLGDSSADRPSARDQAMSYHIGKTGVWMLTRSFAQSEARYGITCNMISPGWMEESIGKLSKNKIPMGRYGNSDDMNHAIEFLIQPESSYLTGSNLMVGGGWNLR